MHDDLERALAAYVGMPRALLFSSDCLANLAVVTVLAGRSSEMFADRLNHASPILAASGILVPAIRPPTVPRSSARLRISLSSAHTDADVDLLIETLRSAEASFS